MKSENLVTIVYPDDRIPAMIIKRSAKSLTCRLISTDALPVNHQCNGFPVYDYKFTEGEAKERLVGQAFKVSLTQKGYRYSSCIPVTVGMARYYRNFAD